MYCNMRIRIISVLAVTCITLTSCAPEESEPATDLAAEEAAVDATSQQWLTHAQAKEAAGIAGLFADDGVLFVENQDPVVGPSAIEAFFRRDFKDNPDRVPNFGSDRIEVAASGDLAVEFGSGGDGDVRKYITVYRKVDGVWKVVGDMSISTKPDSLGS